MSALLTGLVLGSLRFILEVFLSGAQSEGPVGWFVRINFLHFAALMFIVCVVVLIGVSLATPAPSDEKVSGLTWQTVSGHVTQDDLVPN